MRAVRVVPLTSIGMRLRRLPAIALLGAIPALAACEPDNTPDVTAPGGYAFDLLTNPVTATLAAGTDSVRILSYVRNLNVADTTTGLHRVTAISGGPAVVRYRLLQQADTAIVRLRTTTESATSPGLFGAWIVRRAAGSARVITEHEDVTNGRTYADTVTITVN